MSQILGPSSPELSMISSVSANFWPDGCTQGAFNWKHARDDSGMTTPSQAMVFSG